MSKFTNWAIFGLAIAFLAPISQAATQTPGKVSIVKATGKVTAIDKSGAQKPAKTGDTITQGTSLETGADSSAILLFSNGSSITLGQNASFSVDSFMQDPFDEKSVDYRNLKAEPVKSNVRTSLKKGEILGDMAKLKPGSTFEFATQLGVAGIRGTKFKMTVSTGANGKPVWAITCTEGSVSVQPTKNGVPSGPPIVVQPQGEGQSAQATVITLTINEDGDVVVGEPSVLTVPATQSVNSEIEESEATINNLPQGFVPSTGETLFNDNPDGTNDFGGDQGPLDLGTFGSGSGGGGQTNGDLQPSS